MESIVSFKSGRLELRGVIHTPDQARNRVGIILLCPGYKHRVAQHRLYVHIARRLCADGFHVLRFDFHGLGESEGEVKRCLFGDFWSFVQTGGFVSDTIAGVDFFKNEVEIEKVILMGLCGGAITGLMAGAKDARVDGLILINIPVMLEGSSTDWFIDRMPPGLAESLLSGYLHRVTSVRSWLRLFSFKSDYRAIWKSVSTKVCRKLDISKQSNFESYDETRLSSYFLESFKSYCSSGRPLLFIFSGNDKYRWAFESDFQKKFLYSGNEWEDFYSIFVVDRANHSFTSPEWRGALLQKIITWLHHYFETPTSEPIEMEEIEK